MAHLHCLHKLGGVQVNSFIKARAVTTARNNYQLAHYSPNYQSDVKHLPDFCLVHGAWHSTTTDGGQNIA